VDLRIIRRTRSGDDGKRPSTEKVIHCSKCSSRSYELFAGVSPTEAKFEAKWCVLKCVPFYLLHRLETELVVRFPADGSVSWLQVAEHRGNLLCAFK